MQPPARAYHAVLHADLRAHRLKAAQMDVEINDGSGDFEIVIKTIGWLLSVLGALVTFGVL